MCSSDLGTVNTLQWMTGGLAHYIDLEEKVKGKAAIQKRNTKMVNDIVTYLKERWIVSTSVGGSHNTAAANRRISAMRTEERRGGKECRYRG